MPLYRSRDGGAALRLEPAAFQLATAVGSLEPTGSQLERT
jgi:hypothetical protein